MTTLIFFLAFLLLISAIVAVVQSRRVGVWQSRFTNCEKELFRLNEEKNLLVEKMAWGKLNETMLKESFENLSQKILTANTEHLVKESNNQMNQIIRLVKSDWNTQKADIKNIVEPLDKDLAKLEKQVQEIEKKREGAYQNLFSQVTHLTKAHGELQTAANNLSSVLRSSAQVRGKWGEVTLRRIVEMAGMTEHVDFTEQTSASEGGRPDMLIRLPNQGFIPVDAKAPMSAYLDANELTDTELITAKLTEHARMVKLHIQALSKKSYWNQFEHSPEFVIMLIPYEAGMNAAFATDASIFDYALENNVVIVSPATLLALLKVISYGWMQISLAENAKKIALQGKEVYDRVIKFKDFLSKVGSGLKSSVENFNNAVSSLDSRLLPSVRKLKEMGVSGDDQDAPERVDLIPAIGGKVKVTAKDNAKDTAN